MEFNNVNECNVLNGKFIFIVDIILIKLYNLLGFI